MWCLDVRRIGAYFVAATDLTEGLVQSIYY